MRAKLAELAKLAKLAKLLDASYLTSMALALAMMIACGGGGAATDATVADAPGTPDAPVDAVPIDAPDPLRCLGEPIPPVEAATVTVTGETITRTLSGLQVVAGVALDAYRVTDPATSVASAISAADGMYSLTLDTSDSMPFDGYIHATHDQYLDTYSFPPTPFWRETVSGVLVPMIDPFSLTVLQSALDITQDPNNGILIVAVFDCNGALFPGATVVTTPPTTEVFYMENGLPSPTPTKTTADGIAIIFNVPVGTVQVDVELGDQSLREHDVQSIAGAITSTAVVP